MHHFLIFLYGSTVKTQLLILCLFRFWMALRADSGLWYLTIAVFKLLPKLSTSMWHFSKAPSAANIFSFRLHLRKGPRSWTMDLSRAPLKCGAISFSYLLLQVLQLVVLEAFAASAPVWGGCAPSWWISSWRVEGFGDCLELVPPTYHLEAC